MSLDFVNYRQPEFELHKLTFHPTGFIHLTNETGRRYRDGTRGPAFSQMVCPYDFCALAPCHQEQLPELTENRGALVNLALPDEVDPFYATLSFIDPLETAPRASGPQVAPLIVVPIGSPWNLAISMRAVVDIARSEAPAWPPFPFFVLRTAA